MELVDAVVTSAEVGAAKPEPRVFERALTLARAEPGEALHVGDKVDNDVEGAAAAGIRAVLLQREGEPPAGVTAIRSLRELPALL
jgi:putative hydrolase of the HAD superfamily